MTNSRCFFMVRIPWIQVLSEHFEVLLNQNHFNLQSCLDEWMEVKVDLQKERRDLHNNNNFWKTKFQMQEPYPNLLLVIKPCPVIPAQTACCERGNSCVNRILSDFRSTLDVVMVDALMRISLNGGLPPDLILFFGCCQVAWLWGECCLHCFFKSCW